MTAEQRPYVWRWLQGAVALLVLGFFLFALRGILNPFLLFLLLLAVLYPFREADGYTMLVASAVVLTLLWLLGTVGLVIAPFVLSVVLAYMLDPLVDAMQARRVPRVAGIGLLTLPVLGALAAVFFFVIPAAVVQIGELVQQTPVFLQRVAVWLDGLDLPLVDEDRIEERLRAIDSAAVVAFLEERREAIAQRAWGGVLGLGRGFSTVLTILGYVVLTPVLTFYLLRDWDQITHRIGELIPPVRRGPVLSFFHAFDRLLGRYLRGQITVALAVGAVTAAGLWIARFPYAGTLGLIVAVFSVVPYLGLLISLVPAIFIALVSGSVGISLLKIAIVYGTTQGLEAAVISPRIIGESVGLHPVWVLLALALGGFFAGFVGLLIAVPAAVGLKLLVERGQARYQASRFFTGDGGTGP